MIRGRKRILGVAAAGATALLVAAAGCGGSSGSDGGGGGGNASAPAGKKTITVGILTDVTGAAASGNKTSVDGVKAGVVYAARNGYNIKYVVGDTQTTPDGALSAAQKMVTQDHVLVVIAHSALAFTAANYLTAHKVPVVGMAEDGPEWITAKNMFSVVGALQQTKVATTIGKFFKQQSVTNVASIGYSVSPLSSESALASGESAKAAGLQVGYLNAKFPFGSTDVGPTVLAMKKAGIDGFTASVDPNTSFALITGLRQQGVALKVALLPTGYGGDLEQAGPGALNAAQNVYFQLGYEPIELQTAATKQFQSDLKDAKVTTVPTYAMYNGYAAVGLLVRGLKGAGANPTQASLITSLSGIHDWDAMGLFGGRKLDINDRENIVGGAGNCTWVTKLEGDKFTPVKGADPICGDVIPGVTVAPQS
ncbi:ABC transporter substrate-binding protein [Pseudofrankia asymbiotica]|uniref:Branched-chain amino acid ABC transporter substrate-binding protein n=1 Tax=Pseudofrankia asymbiotica TaxID=1834516 RepID=A0A1V2I3W0_9ACTN|nr:ABC transporter substrate-binding protein [Pseudofrankia asymbiotica]ONH24637.1 branched-chain amino acid ABC transporter substrate-binding protein [Pseudofrankia asymbiotica]